MAHIRLHVQQADGHLPMVCMRCGEPATVIKTKKLSWYPRWILAFVFLGAPGILILVILAAVLRKSARLQAPFCGRHQGHWTIRLVITWVSTIAMVLIGVGLVLLMILLDQARQRQPDVLGPFVCVGG